MSRRCLPPLALFFTIALPLAAADWPQWRGPNRDGVSKETGLLKEWPKGGPPLAWKTNLGGVGYSSPAVVGDKLYITGAEDAEKGDKEFLVCLNTKDASQVWKTPLPLGEKNYGDLSRGNGPRATPTVDGDFIYTMGARGNVTCLKRADGSRVWDVDMVKDFGGSPGAWGYSESVLIDGNKLICTPGGSKGTMVALDKATGKQLWRSTDLKDAAYYSSVVVAEVAGVRQYVTQTHQAAVGVRASDGKLLWRVAELGRRTAVIPTAVVHTDRAFFTSGYGAGCELLKLEPDGAGGTKATVIYTQNSAMSNHHGGVVRIGDHVYGHAGNRWVCMNLKSGAEDPVSEFKFDKGSVVSADGLLYLYSENNGTCLLVEATPEKWTEKGRFTIPERTKMTRGGQVWTHPVVANGKLYLRDHDLLFCYDVLAK
jgi:outer membrane protein assembly factor BamB